MKKLLSALLLVVIFGTAQAQKQWVLQSEYLSKNDTVWAFVPENRPDVKAFPTIILLHGYGGDFRQWDKFVGLQEMANEYGFVLVCPDGLRNSWYIDVPGRGGSRYESFFFKTFLPSMFRELPVDPQRLFIDGLSMGGHGAIRFFLRKPELFRAAGSTSGVLHLRCSGLRNTDLKDKLGKFDSEKWWDYMAIGQIGTRRIGNKPLIIDCGRQDHLLECNREFVKKGVEAGYNITYIEQEGKHKPSYWRKTFYLHMAFYKNLLEKDN